MVPLILVGLGSVLLLGWHKGRDVAELLGLSFGFALVVLPFLGYLRLPSLLVSGVFFAGTLFYRLLPGRRTGFDWKRLEGWLCVFVVGLFSLLMFFSLFKHPVFSAYLLMDPQSGATIPYVSVDPIVHIGFVRDILIGNYVPQQATTAYTSGHFLYASLVDRFDIIRSYRHVTVGLAALSPFLVYLVASKVSDSKPTGVLASAMYVAGSPLWIHFTFSAGLMPNFLSLMLALFTVWLLAEMKDWKPAYGIVAFLTGMVFWTSHFTAVLFFPALLVTLALGRASRRHVLCFLAPLIYVAWMLRNEIPGLVNLVVQGGRSPYQYVPNLTTRALLDVHPFLFDWAVVAQGEPVFWLSLLGLAGLVWRLKGKVALGGGFATITPWFLTVIIIGMAYPLGWRSIYPLFAPLSILVPVGLIQVFKPIWNRLGYVQEVKVHRSKTVKVKKWLPSTEIRIAFLLLLVGLIMWGNHSSTLYTYLSRQPELNNFKEEKFNHAILVLSTLPPTNYWAGDDARFEYLKVFDLEVRPMPTANLTLARQMSVESNRVVWQIIASKALAITSQGRQLKGSLAETLSESKLFQQTYTNDYVYVFKPR